MRIERLTMTEMNDIEKPPFHLCEIFNLGFAVILAFRKIFRYFLGIDFWMVFGMPFLRLLAPKRPQKDPKIMIIHPFWRPEPSQSDQKTHPRRNLDFSIDFEPPQASIFKNFQCYSGEYLLVSSLSPATLHQPASKGVGGRSA